MALFKALNVHVILLCTVLFMPAVCFANPGDDSTDLSVWLKADGNVYTTTSVQATNNSTVTELSLIHI